MLKELLNSKMFWLFLATFSGFLCGVLLKRLKGSKQSSSAIAIPFIALFLTLLALNFVKLNVEYFQLKYTLMGLGFLLSCSILLGYVTFISNDKKISYFNNCAFLYTALCYIVFFMFYKNELPINTTSCPETKDIYLLLKKEDAGYFEINPEGIGYIGLQLFTDGFRPDFLSKGIDQGIYDHTPTAIEIPTPYGVVHALYFHSNRSLNQFSLEELVAQGIVKPDELKLGDLKGNQ